jgi:hypothetical protein
MPSHPCQSIITVIGNVLKGQFCVWEWGKLWKLFIFLTRPISVLKWHTKPCLSVYYHCYWECVKRPARVLRLCVGTLWKIVYSSLPVLKWYAKPSLSVYYHCYWECVKRPANALCLCVGTLWKLFIFLTGLYQSWNGMPSHACQSIITVIGNVLKGQQVLCVCVWGTLRKFEIFITQPLHL